MYRHTYSKQTVSNITKAVEVNGKDFYEKTFTKRYVALFCDASKINVRRDTLSKEALHIIVGISGDGHKNVLDYRLFPSEDSSNYAEMLEDLRDRGLTEVLLIITDGLKGIREACQQFILKQIIKHVGYIFKEISLS